MSELLKLKGKTFSLRDYFRYAEKYDEYISLDVVNGIRHMFDDVIVRYDIINSFDLRVNRGYIVSKVLEEL